MTRPVEYRFGRKTGSQSSWYSTGLALWNIASVEKLDLSRVGIPRGEPQRRKGRQVERKVANRSFEYSIGKNLKSKIQNPKSKLKWLI